MDRGAWWAAVYGVTQSQRRLKQLSSSSSSSKLCYWASLVAQNIMKLQCRRPGFDPWVVKIPWRRAWQPTPVFLPGESHGQRDWRTTIPGVAKSQTRLCDLASNQRCYQVSKDLELFYLCNKYFLFSFSNNSIAYKILNQLLFSQYLENTSFLVASVTDGKSAVNLIYSRYAFSLCFPLRLCV